MRERITEDFLADLKRKHAATTSDYKPTCISSGYGNGCAGAVDEDLAFWRAAVDCVPAMLAELRSHRQAELTAEDRAALDWLRADTRMGSMANQSTWATRYINRREAACAVLDRLIAGCSK